MANVKTLDDVALFCEVDTLFPDTNSAAAETDPKATNISYSTGVAKAPVAADHARVKDPSLLGVTVLMPPKVGAVVFDVVFE